MNENPDPEATGAAGVLGNANAFVAPNPVEDADPLAGNEELDFPKSEEATDPVIGVLLKGNDALVVLLTVDSETLGVAVFPKENGPLVAALKVLDPVVDPVVGLNALLKGVDAVDAPVFALKENPPDVLGVAAVLEEPAPVNPNENP